MRFKAMAGTAIEQACKAEIPQPVVKTRACDVFATAGTGGA